MRLHTGKIMRTGGDMVPEIPSKEIGLLLIAVRGKKSRPEQVHNIVPDHHHFLTKPFIQKGARAHVLAH